MDRSAGAPDRSGGAALPALLAAAAAAAVIAGCNTMDGPATLTLPSAEYRRAFDACLDAARDAGMPALLADRGIGVIDTTPRHVGSLMEPWRLDSSGLQQTTQATLQYERRRLRFEFVPVGFTLPAAGGQGALRGPDVPGGREDRARFDLEHYDGPVELRAWVFIERGFTPGLKPGNWSLSLTTTWTDTVTNRVERREEDPATSAPTQWTPVARDDAMERTLMAGVERRMGQEPATAPPGDGAGGAGTAANAAGGR